MEDRWALDENGAVTYGVYDRDIYGVINTVVTFRILDREETPTDVRTEKRAGSYSSAGYLWLKPS